MILRFLVVCGLLCLALFMLFAFLGQWKRPLDSFSHFLHYYMLALLGVAAVAAFLKMKKTAIVSLATFAVGVFLLGPAQPFAFSLAKTNGASSPRDITVMTFNMLYLNDKVEEINNYINNQDPDIIFLQEVSPKNEALLERLKNYPHQQRCHLNRMMSIMVLSKARPIAQDCLAESRLAWMELKLNGQTFRAISTHLHWPWPLRQWEQIDSLRNDIALWDQDTAIVLGGDFNAVPWSHAVRTIEDIIHSKIVPGFRMTLYKFVTLIEAPLFVPIDQILLPANAAVKTAHVGPDLGSDHRPVTVTMTLGN